MRYISVIKYPKNLILPCNQVKNKPGECPSVPARYKQTKCNVCSDLDAHDKIVLFNPKTISILYITAMGLPNHWKVQKLQLHICICCSLIINFGMFNSNEYLFIIPHSTLILCFDCVGWLVVFYVPSTSRSFRDGTPIYCPLWRTWSLVYTPFPP